MLLYNCVLQSLVYLRALCALLYNFNCVLVSGLPEGRHCVSVWVTCVTVCYSLLPTLKALCVTVQLCVAVSGVPEGTVCVTVQF